jgi:hypothetical protein
VISVAGLMADVRRIVKDESPTNPRHTDEDVLAALRIAIATVRRLRPDAFSPVFGAEPPAPQATGSLELDTIFGPPMAKIAAAELLLTNSEYAESGAASAVLGLGIAGLVAR